MRCSGVIRRSLLLSHLYTQLNINEGLLITDQEYPVRPAFSLLNKILDEFATTVPQSSYIANNTSFPQLAVYLAKYQDPKQADSILKVQQELDETKIILVGIL